MTKIYDVWVASNAYGDREEHCGCVRANDADDAMLLANDLFSDSIRTSKKDRSQQLDHLYVSEWTPCDDDESEPVCAND